MEPMNYITSVKDSVGIKHIIQINGKDVWNVEVRQPEKVEPYGNKKGEHYFSINGIKVFADGSFMTESSSNSFYLPNVVFAIEVVMFTMKHLGINNDK